MILLDENHNTPLWLWFRNFLCVLWQSLRSNSVLPTCLAQQQDFNALYTTNTKNRLERISSLSKGNIVSIIDNCTVIPHLQQSLFDDRVSFFALALVKSKTNRYSLFLENKSLHSISRVGAAFHTINTQIFNLISSFVPMKK